MENKRKARVILVVICGVLMSVACGLWGMQKKAEAQVADQEAKRLQQELETQEKEQEEQAKKEQQEQEQREKEEQEKLAQEEAERQAEAEEQLQEAEEKAAETVEVVQVEPSQNEPSQPAEDWVTNLNVANQTNQLIIVAASGTSATVSMHTKGADGVWVQNLATNGYVGSGGVGQASEYATCSPRGVWGFTCAFGNQPNPGTALGYTQVDDTYYWVDDVNSAYYNRFVTTREVAADWSSAEHISGCGSVYNYVLALNYNADCIPENGSAFFLHCSSGKPTAGCVSVPESVMIQILQNIQPGCLIVIDTESGVYGY
jgi:L,D-peptidoglycan transpeptidase YkuD (ErfK/YbiS/YcfS/YnhG family)